MTRNLWFTYILDDAKSRRTAFHVSGWHRQEDARHSYRNFDVATSWRNNILPRSRRIWQDNIKADITDTGWYERR
jgi:hypothetical protein